MVLSKRDQKITYSTPLTLIYVFAIGDPWTRRKRAVAQAPHFIRYDIVSKSFKFNSWQKFTFFLDLNIRVEFFYYILRYKYKSLQQEGKTDSYPKLLNIIVRLKSGNANIFLFSIIIQTWKTLESHFIVFSVYQGPVGKFVFNIYSQNTW